MKKRFKIITILDIILILGILILFCSKVDKISLIENIRQKIVKSEEIEKVNEVTTIDVTDLEDGRMIEHEHICKTMYDENTHWKECTICKQKINEENHEFIKTWKLGHESCSEANSYTNTCKCGYKYTGRKEHINSGRIESAAYVHYFFCTNTVDGKHYASSERCKALDGTILDCNHPGVCNVCKKRYTKSDHNLSASEVDNMIHCDICDSTFGTFNREISRDLNNPGTYIITTQYNLENGVTYKQLSNSHNIAYFEYERFTLKEKKSNTQFAVIHTLKFKPNCEQIFKNYYIVDVIVNENGTDKNLKNGFYLTELFPDIEEPNISSITMENKELLEWSKNKPIIITGTENYCNNVNVEIIDDEERRIFIGNTVVDKTNRTYSISCTPEIECDTNGRTFKVIVTDTCENSIEQEFKIAKVDSVAPRPKSDTEILGDWAKSKNFTFKATDGGIGNVSIAFNDIEDLQLANSDGIEYSRDYEFVGDVYKQKELSVLYRDGLGNTSMQKIVIDKIDNTAPTILETKFHNNKLIIKSNDEKEGIGEGSGVVKYRYFTSREKIENPEIKNSAKEVDKDDEIIIDDIVNMKYVYVVAEDYVGNISKVYEVEIPKLVLTSEVQLDGSNGKGTVKLDWSSYDIEDKYFVIYRKEENAEEWETIVSLDEKFNGSSYIDNLANDKKSPNKPNIVIDGNQENNSINILASASDRGSKYTYYIEAYDNKGALINISNTQ